MTSPSPCPCMTWHSGGHCWAFLRVLNDWNLWNESWSMMFMLGFLLPLPCTSWDVPHLLKCAQACALFSILNDFHVKKTEMGRVCLWLTSAFCQHSICDTRNTVTRARAWRMPCSQCVLLPLCSATAALHCVHSTVQSKAVAQEVVKEGLRMGKGSWLTFLLRRKCAARDMVVLWAVLSTERAHTQACPGSGTWPLKEPVPHPPDPVTEPHVGLWVVSFKLSLTSLFLSNKWLYEVRGFLQILNRSFLRISCCFF